MYKKHDLGMNHDVPCISLIILTFTVCAVVYLMKMRDMGIFVISRECRILIIGILTRSVFTHFAYCRTFDTTFHSCAPLSGTVPLANK